MNEVKMIATKEGIWHGDIMAMKSLLPYPHIFIYFQDYIKIGDIMSKIKRVCLECGKEFEVFPVRTKKGWAKYCSRGCYGKVQSRMLRGAKAVGWKGGPKKLICEQCGKEFETRQCYAKRGGAKYCTPACFYNARSKEMMGENNHHWNGGKIERECQECGKIFLAQVANIKKGWGKYCSLSCARKNRRFPTHHTKPERIFEEICKRNTLPFRNVSNSKLWIGKTPSLNPDFVESNGKKVAIFINGDYWHSPLLRYNIRDSQRADVQMRICKRHKWKPIILWETDLLREDAEEFVLETLKKEGIKW
jgi:G:T-mismatch repair DNA endonuclease (very short patch repair protein)